MKTLIIDDEKLARSLVKAYLSEIPDIEIVGEAENGFEGIKKIKELMPDLILLDIQMPKLNGFEMLELLPDPKPKVIFCTAYDQFAIKAFEQNALDYLLKPFDQERLSKAIEKARTAKVSEKKETPKIVHQESQNRIAIKDGEEINILPVDKVLYIEAQDDYVEIHTQDKKFLKQETMKHLESTLNPADFVRIHRKFIVKVSEIKKLEKYGKETYVAIINAGASLSVSASGYKKLKEVLNL